MSTTLNIYTDVTEGVKKQEFAYYFQVVLPNRSVAEPAQMSIDLQETQSESEKTQLGGQKTQSGPEKTQLVTRNNVPDQDWELIYFRDVFLKKHGEGLRKRTLERILLLFERYRYTYNFNRRNVADLFSITENGGSVFLSNCIERGIVRRVKVDEYCFVMKDE